MGKQFSKENPLSIFQISICLPLPPFITDTVLLLRFFSFLASAKGHQAKSAVSHSQ